MMDLKNIGIHKYNYSVFHATIRGKTSLLYSGETKTLWLLPTRSNRENYS